MCDHLRKHPAVREVRGDYDALTVIVSIDTPRPMMLEYLRDYDPAIRLK